MLTETPAEEKPSPLGRFETALIVLVSAAMILLPMAAALGRWLWGASLNSAIVTTQHLTLWAGFVGALIATGARAHLSLATNDLLPARFRPVASFAATTVAGAVTAVLAYATVLVIQVDMDKPDRLFQIIPAWWSEAIAPLALGLMAVRCAYLSSEKWALRGVSFVVIASAFTLGLAEGNAAAILAWPIYIAIVGAVLLGAPLYVGMAGLAMAFFFSNTDPIAGVPIEMFRLVESPSLPAIPLLTLCGYVLAESGASVRLVRAARAWVGFLPGGIAIMVTLVCALFTTLTGGSGVTIIALGGLMLPILIKEGYPEDFSLGLVSAAGSLGLLLPPSLPVILYSVVAETSADRLFLGGLLPGLLLIFIVVGYAMVVGVRYRIPRQSFDLKEAFAALWDAKWELAIPLTLVVLIFSGGATIAEAAALAAFMAIAVESVIHKDLSLTKQMPRVITQSGRLMGAVLIVLGAAMGLTSYLVIAEVPARLLAWVTEHVHSQWLFLLALNVILLVLGSVLEIFSAIVILAPLLVPMATSFQIDPVHMGVVFLANLELGFLFPPVGLNLLLASSRFRVSLPRMYRVAAPFLLIMAAGVLAITYLPWMSIGFAALFK